MKTIYELVRKMEGDDVNGITTISKYVEESMRDEIEKVDAYLNSKHTSGETDSLGRDKPFFNISIAARNIWFRATDIDRKNIRVKATKKAHQIISLLGTILLGEWMRKSGFGKFLNDWGLTLASYGSAVPKFVEKEGELICNVVPWNQMICDSIDFENNIKIEKLWLTPAQLKKNKNYNKDLVESLLTALTARETGSKQKKDTKAEYIPIYEVSGELPLSYLTDNEDDEDEYVQQTHHITFLKSKEKGEFDDYTLYSGRGKDPYMITHLIARDGYTLAGGAVKNLFQVQWMMNHTAKQIKDQLDLASKILFQTSDGNFVGQNVLTAIENGNILIHALNQPLTLLNNRGDTVSLENFGVQWKALGNEINGISESMLGINPPSGTAWGLERAKLTESHSLFALMTQNKGLYIEEMLRRFVIPFLKKKMDTTDEISAILEAHQITQIDSMYVPNEVIRRTNNKVKQTILNGGIVDPVEMEAFKTQQMTDIQSGLNQQGNQRFIKPSDISTKTWKNVLKDLEWDIEIDITGEEKDTQMILQTLSTALQVIVNPAFTGNKKVQLVIDRILEETGVISPLELSQIPEQAQPMPMAQQMPQTSMVGGAPVNQIK
jgi:hypothetical protein